MQCKEKSGISSFLIPLFILTALLVFPHSGKSQEIRPVSPGTESSELVETDEISPLNEARSLVRETIYMDITTASYYELQDWLLRLDLPVSGTRTELENRLLTYYRSVFSGVPLTSIQEQRETETKGNLMEIESAGQLTYEKDEQGSQVIRLSGGVLLHMRDSENDTVHTVEAQSIVFNRKQNSVSAIGDVRYRMEKDNTSQDFRGQEITFDIENFRGVFIRGMSSRPAQIQDQQVTFYFRGTTIYRIQRDIVRLENGIISSSRVQDPYYSIAAGNVWILGIDEWAIRDATLYIGHVPLLYIPFYYHPGDTFVFHPSIGMRSLEGYYAQTSTYFFGRKPEGEDTGGSFSFLQAVEEDQTAYSQELRGFFLRNSREPLEKNWITRTGSYGKFQFDYYTRLGILSAVKIDLQDLGAVKKFDMTFGAGYTNYIYTLPGYSGLYTSLQYDTGQDTYLRNIQKPYLFGARIPFRLGLDVSLEIQRESFGFDLNIPFYSDLLLHDQLSKRNEKLEWSRFLTGEGVLDLDSFEDYENPQFVQHTDFSIAPLEKSRFVDTFRVDKLDSRLTFGQSDLNEDDLALNKLGYYYPDVFTPIDLEVTMSGTLLKTGSDDRVGEKEAQSGRDDQTDPDIEQFKPPAWKEDFVKSEEVLSVPEPEYKIPDKGQDIILARKQIQKPFTHSLTYSFTPDVSYHTQYDTDQMSDKSPEEVRFDPLYSYVFTDGSAVFQYNASMFQDQFRFSQTTRTKGRYRDHFNGEDLEDLVEQDRELSYLEIVGLTELTHFFWKNRPAWSETYIGYEIETDLYTYTFDQDGQRFESSFPSWDEESIQVHRTSLGFIYDIWGEKQKLVFSYTLPPRLQSLNSLLDLRTGPVRSTVEFDMEENESSVWGAGPLQITETLSLFHGSSISQKITLLQPENSTDDMTSTVVDLHFIPDMLTFTQNFDWNLSGDRPETSISSLKTGWWTNRFEARYADDYTFSAIDGWETVGTKAFQPYRFSSEIKIPYEPDLFWKNRVQLQSSFATSLQLNLIRYNESLLQFSWDTSLSIAEFVDLKLSIKSANNAIFRYIPAFSEELGKEPIQLFDDLIKSFNFFNYEDRIASNFNLQSISFSFIHYMHDWRLQMQYSGIPQLDEQNIYKWYSEFSIFLQWNPIPEIRKEAEYDKEGLRI